MLCRNHSAAIVDCPLRERVARFELILGFHIDDEPDQLFRLCVRLRRNSVEADIVVDGAFRQRCILTVAAADGAVRRGTMRTVCIICMNTDCADFRLPFDVLFRNLIDWAGAILLYAALHDMRQHELVCQQLFSGLIIPGFIFRLRSLPCVDSTAVQAAIVTLYYHKEPALSISHL